MAAVKIPAARGGVTPEQIAEARNSRDRHVQEANDVQKAQLKELFESERPSIERLQELKKLYTDLGAFETAESLVDKSQARAEALADEVDNEDLRQLLYFLVDSVLAHEEQTPADPPTVELQLTAPPRP